jgi:hypothetical protein
MITAMIYPVINEKFIFSTKIRNKNEIIGTKLKLIS